MVAFVAAAVVAVGPANASRGDYRWPARAASSFVPSGVGSGRMLFVPLLLSRHRPARLSVDAPCAVVRAAVRVTGERFTVLATTNNVSSSGLWLVVEAETLRLGVGGTVLAEGRWRGASLEDPGCMVSAGFRGEEWHLKVGRKELGRGRSLAPVVTGLFTQLPRPVEGDPGLSVRVVTGVAGSSPSFRQLALTVIAAGAGAVALVLLIGSAGRRREMRVGSAVAALGRVARRLAWVDAVVLAGVVSWWFFGPVFYDDGWLLSVVLNFPKRGAFSNYYEVFDAQYPQGFLHFLFHFGSSRVSTSLLWMRFPVLVMGVATWALLRAYLAKLRGPDGLASRVALASVFLVFWFAWSGSGIAISRT